MASITPKVTKFVITGTGMADALDQLYAHFNRVDAVKKWEIDARSTPTASQGFTITPVGGGLQVNLRYVSTSTANVVVDPLEGITASGGTGVAPTGASAMASPELTSWHITTATALVLLEWDDAFMMLMETASSYYLYMLHVGRIFTPSFSDDASHGIDGLGVLGYRIGHAGANDWFATSAALSRIRVANTGVVATDWSNSIGIIYPGALTTNQDRIGTAGIYHPSPIPLLNGTYSQSAYMRILGILKYVFRTEVTRMPRVRLNDGTTDKWMHINTSAAVGYYVVPWEDGVAP